MSAKPKTTLPPEDQVFVALQRAANRVNQEAEQLLKSHRLTGTQYNVLRILRGAGPEGLPCSAVGERMITHDPDMTRLLDRLEKRGLITRERQTDDRRVIKTRITGSGLEELKALDAPVRDLHQRQFRGMTARRLKELLVLLEDVQSGREAQ